MITDADIKKMKKVFVTKDDLQKLPSKIDLQKALKDQKEEIVEAVGEYIADTIVPMFDQRDKKISRIEKKLNLPPLAD